jgi:hypothetical protein
MNEVWNVMLSFPDIFWSKKMCFGGWWLLVIGAGMRVDVVGAGFSTCQIDRHFLPFYLHLPSLFDALTHRLIKWHITSG